MRSIKENILLSLKESYRTYFLTFNLDEGFFWFERNEALERTLKENKINFIAFEHSLKAVY